MTGAKFNIKKFDETDDFDMEAEEKVLREVTGVTAVAGVWSKLETLYMKKSLANKLYLKKKLYTFYMSDRRKISKHIEVNFEDEDLALLLLNSLPPPYEHFAYNLLIGREALTLEDVMATLVQRKSKKYLRFKPRKLVGKNLKNYGYPKEKGLRRKGDNGEGLYVRGRTDTRDSRKSNKKSRSNLEKSTSYVKKDDQPNSSGSIYDGSEVLLDDKRECKIEVVGELNASVEEKGSLTWAQNTRTYQRCGTTSAGKARAICQGTSRWSRLKMDKVKDLKTIWPYTKTTYGHMVHTVKIRRHMTIHQNCVCPYAFCSELQRS
ncbi:hypothetical protein Tco_0507528 [Tanacetum coccineum]